MPASLTVIVGCMFSGKSEELFRLLKRADIARLRAILIKPSVDTRSTNQICSRDGRCMPAKTVTHSEEIADAARRFDVIGIDEAQFFDSGIVEAVDSLYRQGKRVIVAGLDADYRGHAFGAMPQLLAIPEADVVKLRAVCMRCGAEATRTHRKSQMGAQVEIGDADTYEALCHPCTVAATAAMPVLPLIHTRTA